jgi:cation:H+ antiporter
VTLPGSDVVLSFLFYLAVIGGAGLLLGRGAESLLTRFSVKLTGGVILGFVETLPEYIFAIVAVSKGSSQVALGSAYGGNIVLFTLVFGLMILSSGSKGATSFGYKGSKSDVAILLVSSTLFLILLVGIHVVLVAGLSMIALFGLFLVSVGPVEVEVSGALTASDKHRSLVAPLLLLVIAAALIVAFIDPLLNSVEQLSTVTGISPILLSLIFVPLANELPELFSSIKLYSSGENGRKAAVASLLGSKIQSNTLLLGSVVLLASFLGNPISVSGNSSKLSLYAMVATSYLGALVVGRAKPSRRTGILLLLAYLLSSVGLLTF